MEREFFKGMQRIMMNENLDRSLRREQTRRMLDGMKQPTCLVGRAASGQATSLVDFGFVHEVGAVGVGFDGQADVDRTIRVQASGADSRSGPMARQEAFRLQLCKVRSWSRRPEGRCLGGSEHPREV